MVNLKILDYICCCFVSHADERSELPFSQLSNPSPNTASHSDVLDTATDDTCESSEMVIGLSQEQFQTMIDHIKNQMDFDDDKSSYILEYLTSNNVCIDTEQALAFIEAIHFSNAKIVFIEQLLPYIVDLKSGKKKLVSTIGFYNDKIKVKKLISEHLKQRKLNGTFMKPSTSTVNQPRTNSNYRPIGNDSTELDSFSNGKPKQISGRSTPNYQNSGNNTSSEYYTTRK
ncbi:hypothetical protein C9374_007778 [Naegleria lovaniensis]|uniref:DUF4476 domain-containing protein n=1 Tax=Naegleria lovaniensis TaxID=51637 RepID=A0AA88GLM5_NAELO|nr:uncharacterized protein C9374_007778 [Naegleria lovaniensis]KAG2379140.1 hypothetical protein C9374_007778 [Naegleria lovaniensis]